VIKKYIGLYVKYPLCVSDFNESWIFLTDLKKIYWNFTSPDDPSSGSLDVPCGRAGGRSFGRADGRTDRQKVRSEEANSPFRNFANAPKNDQLSLHISFFLKMATLCCRPTSIMQLTSTVCHQPGIVPVLLKFEFILARNLSFWRTKFKIISPFLEAYFWFSAGLLLVYSLACRSWDTVFCITCIHSHQQHPTGCCWWANIKYHMWIIFGS
jgi:hypothetical protein